MASTPRSSSSVDPTAVRDVRERFGDRLVISVGRLVYYKGFDVLIRAMAEVRGKLVIVGDGPLRGELRSRSRFGCGRQSCFRGRNQQCGRDALLSCRRSVCPGVGGAQRSFWHRPDRGYGGRASGGQYRSRFRRSVCFTHEQTGLTVPPAIRMLWPAPSTACSTTPICDTAFGRAANLRAQQDSPSTPWHPALWICTTKSSTRETDRSAASFKIERSARVSGRRKSPGLLNSDRDRSIDNTCCRCCGPTEAYRCRFRNRIHSP